MVITLFFVVTITFFLMRSIPGNPLGEMVLRLKPEARENFERIYGLDKPLHIQYLKYLQNLAKFDLGQSLRYPGKSVNSLIAGKSPVSFRVGLIALIGGTLLGVALGMVAALFKNKWPDYIVMFLAVIGIALPAFVTAVLMRHFLVSLPVRGLDSIQAYIIPVVALSFGTIATYARYIKASMLDTMNQDYIMTAQSKGVSNFDIVRKHALRNAVLPSMAMLAARFSIIFTGNFVIERMFDIPGLGGYFVDSLFNNDYTMIMGLIVYMCAIFLVTQLVLDIAYMIVDPRIRTALDKSHGG